MRWCRLASSHSTDGGEGGGKDFGLLFQNPVTYACNEFQNSILLSAGHSVESNRTMELCKSGSMNVLLCADRAEVTDTGFDLS